MESYAPPSPLVPRPRPCTPATASPRSSAPRATCWPPRDRLPDRGGPGDGPRRGDGASRKAQARPPGSTLLCGGEAARSGSWSWIGGSALAARRRVSGGRDWRPGGGVLGATGRQRLDRLGFLATADRDASRLGRRGDRDRERQHAVLAVGLEVFGVQRVAEEDLAGVGPLRPLGHDHLVALSRLKAPLGPHRQHVLLDGQIDRRGLHAWEVELDDELLPAAVGVHRERPRRTRSGGRELLAKPVELAKRIKA